MRNKKLSPCVKTGIGLGYLLHTNNSVTKVDFGGVAHTYSPLVELNTMCSNLLFGAGINVSNFAIEGRYQMTGFGASSKPSKVPVGAIAIMVAYRLRK